MTNFRAYNYTAYKITNSSNKKVYIGITTRKLDQRWSQHLSYAKNNRGYRLHKAMRKIGIKKFMMKELYKTSDWEKINSFERKMIKKHNSIHNGYNTNFGGSFGSGFGNPITINGKKFISLASAARYYGDDAEGAYQRIKKYGWTVKQAFGLAPPPKRDIWKNRKDAISITVNGKIFKTLREACKKHNESEGKIRARLSNGWTPDQAFGFDEPRQKPLSNNAIKIKVEGVIYPSLSKAANHYNLGRHLVQKRYTDGWTTRQIFGLRPPPLPKPVIGKKITLKGIRFNSLAEAARYFKINPKKADDRMRNGWSKEEAFEIKKRVSKPGGEQNGKVIHVEGKKFSSMKKAAKHYGLDNRKVWKRINIFGWSVKEAFNLVERKR